MLNDREKIRRSAVRVTVYPMLGALMFLSDLLMEAFPNVHLVGMLVMAYTLTFRADALVPVYVYVLLNGFYMGFSPWWVPYIYVWTVLLGLTMLLPKKMPKTAKLIVYPAICSLHGFLFGVLCAPGFGIAFGLGVKEMIAWTAAGFTFDVIHGVSNLLAGMLVFPLSELLSRSFKKIF